MIMSKVGSSQQCVGQREAAPRYCGHFRASIDVRSRTYYKGRLLRRKNVEQERHYLVHSLEAPRSRGIKAKEQSGENK